MQNPDIVFLEVEEMKALGMFSANELSLIRYVDVIDLIAGAF
jgi:hypothetical protein